MNQKHAILSMIRTFLTPEPKPLHKNPDLYPNNYPPLALMNVSYQSCLSFKNLALRFLINGLYKKMSVALGQIA